MNNTSYTNSQRYSNLSNNTTANGSLTITYTEGDIISNLRTVDARKTSIDIEYTATNEPFITYYLIIESLDKTFRKDFQYKSQTNYRITGLTPETPYNITLSATTFYGKTTTLYLETTTLNPPDPPTNLIYTDKSNTYITIQYDPPVQTIDYYTVYVYYGSTLIRRVDLSGNIYTYQIDGLTQNLTYSIGVKAINAFGVSDFSNILNVKTTQIPNQPSNIVILPGVQSGIFYFDLTYTPPPQTVDHYIITIVRADISGGSPIIYQTTNTSYRLSGLISNKPYTISLVVNNSDGNSIPVIITKYTLGNIDSSTFSNVFATNLTLNISGSFSSVNVYNSGNVFLFNYDFSAGRTITGLSANTPYFYYLVPLNFDNAFGPRFTTGTKYTLASGSSSYTSEETGNSMKINWRGTYSQVAVSRNSQGILSPSDASANYPLSTSSRTNVTGYITDTGLLYNQEYSYTITLYNGEGVAYILNSNLVGRTKTIITNARFSSIQTNQITISDISGYYDKYSIIRIPEMGTFSRFDISNINITSFTDTDLSANAKYTYTIYPYALINNSYYLEGQIYTGLGYTYTLPAIYSANYSQITDSSIKISDISGEYSSLKIYRYKNSALDASYTLVGLNTEFVDSVGLIPNTAYVYKLLPFNFVDISGGLLELGEIYTDSSGAPTNCKTISESSLEISWNGYYTSVNVERQTPNGNILLGNNLLGTNYFVSTSPGQLVLGNVVDIGLLSNTQYAYNIIMYNGNNVTKTITTGTSFGNTTSGNMISYSYGNITANSIEIKDLSGNYSYVSLRRNDGNIINVSGAISSVIDGGLNSNNQYNYSIIPYNSANIGGNTYPLGNIYTLGKITNAQFGTITDSSIQISNILGNYSYIYAIRKRVGFSDVSFAINYPATSGIDSGLSYNSLYSYDLIPYNVSGVSGNLVSLGSKYTLGNGISSGTTNITANSCRINWSGTYTTIGIVRNPGNVSVNGSGQNFPNSQSSGSNVTGYVTDTGLLANTLYTYSISLFNGNDVAVLLQNQPAVTLPIITSASFDGHTSTSITLTAITGNYSYIIISRTGGQYGSTTFRIDSPENSYTDISGLVPDTSYNYSLIPYNSSDISGQTYNIGYIYTDAVGNSLPVTNITTNSVLINWSGIYANAIVLRYPPGIQVRNAGNITNNYINGSSSWTSTVIGNVTDIGLTPNNSYTYKITLYNGNSYPTVLSNVTANTLPSITSATYSVPTIPQTLSVEYISGYYTKFTYTRIGGIEGTYTSGYITGNSFVDPNILSKNTQYTYTIIPYNIDDASGSTTTILNGGGGDGTIYTLPEITGANITNIGTNSIGISINPNSSYYYCIVNRTDNGSNFSIYQTDGSGTDITSLLPNTGYNYTITPYNRNDVSYNSFMFSNSIYTLGKITSVQLNSTDSQISANSVIGNYKFFKYQRSGGTEGQYMSNSIYVDNFIDPTVLMPNTEYIYNLIPYNYNDISSNAFAKSIYTLPKVTAIFANATTSSITFDLSGKYQYVIINKTTLSGINTSATVFWPTVSYLDNNFIQPDISYNYEFIPYGDTDIVGNTYLAGPIYSLPSLTGASVGLIETESITISNISGSFKYVNILRTGGGIPSNLLTVNYPDSSISDTGLFPDTSYNYILTPYTETGIAGAPINLGTIYTKPILYSATYIDISNLSVTIDISGVYNSVIIARSDGDTGTIYYPESTYTDNTVIPNNSYSYSLIPYNFAGNEGVSYDLSGINTKSLGNVTSVVGVTDTSAKISWTGYYTNMTVTRNSGLGNIDLSLELQNYPNSNSPTQNLSGYIIDTNLQPGTSYFYTMTMYNFDGYSYLVGNSIAYVTLPTIYSSSFGNLTTSSIEVTNISGAYTYIIGNAVPSTGGSTVDFSFNSTAYTINGLLENKNYTINLIPYNSETSYGYVFSAGTISTLPTLRSAVYGNITQDSIEIRLIDGSYNTVEGYRNENITATLSVGYPNASGIDSTGLSPNTSYYYTLIPFNGNTTPEMGANLVLSNVYTSASGTSLLASNETSSSLLVNWSGIYSNAIVSGVGRTANLITGNSNNYSLSSSPQSLVYGNITDSGLFPNTLYSYDISLNNQIGNSIGLNRQSRYTLCELAGANFGNLSSTSIYIQDISGINGYSRISISAYDILGGIISENTGITGNAYNVTGLTPNSYHSMKILPYNGNLVAGHINSGNLFEIGNTYTLCVISSISIGTYTNSSISVTDITAQNGYNNVNVFAIDGNSNIGGNSFVSGSDNSCNIVGLQGNKEYAIELLPYNSRDISGHINPGNKYINSGNLVTLCNITDVSYGDPLNFSSSQISIHPIYAENGYSNIQLYRYASNGVDLLTILDKGTTGNITDIGLSPNTNYIYGLLPKNSVGISGHQNVGNVYKVAGNTCTLCEITSSGLTEIHSRYISMDSIESINGYSSVNFYRGNGGNSSLQLVGSVNGPRASYTDNSGGQGLLPNTLYNYWIMPFNNNSVGGHMTYNNKFFVDSKYTLCEISDISAVALSPSGISICGVTGINDYTNVIVYRSDLPGVEIGNILSPSDIIIDLSASSPNTQYTYNLLPYNYSELAGNANLNEMAIKSIYTLASGQSLTPTDISSNALQINWEGTYGNVLIQRVGGTFTFGGDSAYYMHSDITPTIFMTGYANDVGLNTNTLYTYNISFVNMDGIQTGLSQQSRYTLGSGSSLSFGDISANALQIKWSGIYSSVSVTRNGNVSVVDFSGNNYPNSSLPQTSIFGNCIDAGLSPNTPYTYDISFINGNGTASAIPQINRYTLSSGLSITPVALSSSSIQAYWVGTYSSLFIYRNGEDFSGNIIGESNTISPYPQSSVNGYVIDSGLVPNTEYYYDISMANANGIYTNLTRKYMATLCSIVDVSVNILGNSITVGNVIATNGFGKVEIYDASMGGNLLVTLNTSTDTYTAYSGNIPGNTGFSFYLLPYSTTYNLPGNETPDSRFNSTISTYASIISANISNIESVGIFIGNVVGDNGYSKVEIYRQDTGGLLYATLYSPVDSFTDTTVGGAGTNYTYNLLPYNFENKAGNGSQNAYYSYLIASEGIINTASFRDITAYTSVLDISGIFSNVFVTYTPNVGITPLSGNRLFGGNSISQFYSGFLPNQTYSFSVYPINSIGFPSSPTGTNYYSLSFTSLSDGNILPISDITSTSMKLNWYGIYSTASILLNGTTIVSATGGNNYFTSGNEDGNVIGNAVSDGLTPNTMYYYDTLLYNKESTSISLERVGAYTLASISSAGFGTITSTSINITNIVANGNGYANIALYNNTLSTSQYAGNATSITDSASLLPNTEYNYSLLPYNGNNVPGSDTYNSPFLVGNTCTLSLISNVGVSASASNIVVSGISGNYTSCDVYSNSIGGNIYLGNVSGSGDRLSDLSANNLSYPNTLFSYYIMPYNQLGVMGNDTVGNIVQCNKYSYAYATFSPISDISTNALQVNWTGTYANVIISRAVGGGSLNVQNGTSNYYPGGNGENSVAGNIIDTGLAVNKLYAYDISVNNPDGDVYSVGRVGRYTLAGGNSLVCSDISAMAIQVNWDGTFSNAIVMRNTATLVSEVGSNNYSVSSSPQGFVYGNAIDTGLIPNNMYTYNITLYNGNVVATQLSPQSRYTLAYGNSYSVTDISSTSLQLTWDGYYTAIAITRDNTVSVSSSGGTNYPLSITPGGDVNGIAIDYGLSPNTNYYYTYVMQNGNSVTSNLIAQSHYTLASISGGGFGTSTSSSISLSGISGTNGFSKVDIYKNGTYIGNIGSGASSYTDSVGLSPNNSYSYTLIPYNQSGVAGHNTVGGNYSVGNKYTLSLLTGYSISAASGNVILSGINGYYGNVNVYRSGNILTAITASGDTYTDILANAISSPNTLYTYNLLPYNSEGVAGNGTSGANLTVSTYTLSYVTGYQYTINASNVVIYGVTGTYSNVQVYKSGNTTLLGTIINSGNTVTDNNPGAGGGNTAPNTLYGYNLVPYNFAGVIGNVTLNSNVTIGVYSLSVISSATLSPLSSTSISINNIVSPGGGYSNIQINNTTTGNTYYAGNATSFTDLSGIVPNTQYTYTLMPYNNDGVGGNGVSGSTVSIGNTYSLASINSATITSTGNSITISSVTGQNGYSKTEVYDLSTNGNLLSSIVYSTDTYLASGLSPNTLYSYYLLPYNGPDSPSYVRSIISTSNLSYYYRFNVGDSSGGNIANYGSGTAVYDLSGNTALISSADKKLGTGSLLLNGTSQYLQLPPITSGTNGLSFSAWIKLSATNTNTYDPIVTLYDTTTSYISLYALNSANIVATSGNLSVTSGSVLSKNSWIHLASTFDASGKTSIYFNGSLTANSVSGFETINSGTKANCYIGYNNIQKNPTDYIFRVVLTNSTIPTSVTVNGITTTITKTNTVNVVNDATKGYVLYLSGSGYLMTSAISVSQNCTRCFWAYVTIKGGNFFSSIKWPFYFSATHYVGSQPGYTVVGGNALVQDTTDRGVNSWVFYASTVTYNSTTNTSTVSLYVNNNSAITNTFTGYYSENAGIQFGAYPNGVNTCSAYLHDIRVYTRALSSTEILYIYNSTGGGGALPSDNNYFNGYIDDFRLYKRVLTAGEISILAAGNSIYNGVAGHNTLNNRYSTGTYTLSSLTGYSISATSGNVVLTGITGVYANVNVYRSGSGTVLSTFTASGDTYEDITANSINNPNALYMYNLLPYNSIGVSGNFVSGANLVVSTRTLSYLTGYNFNAGTGNVVITGVTGTYGNVNVYRSGNATVLASFTSSGNTYTDIIANSTSYPNTLYTYNLIPYNSSGVSGNITSSGNLTFSGYTLSKLTGYSISAVTGNVVLTGVTGFYANVNVYRSGTGTVLSAFTASGDMYEDINANNVSTPNTLYTYNLLPFNSGGVSGNLVSGANLVASIYTFATGTLNAIDGQTATGLRLNWSGAYSTVSISRVSGGGTFTAGAGNNYSSGGGATVVNGNVYDTGLSNNTLYTYDVSLNNGNGIGKYIGQVGAYTLASGTPSAPTDLTSTSMTINWTGTYNSVYAYQNGNSTALTGTGNNYNTPSSTTTSVIGNLSVTGLSPNTMYYYDISMVNGNGIPNGITRAGAYTLCQLTSGSYGQSGNTTVTIQNIAGINNYNSIQIFGRTNAIYGTSGQGYKGTITYPSNSFTITGLTPNTNFNFDLRPYNGNGVYGHLTLNSGYALGTIGTIPDPPTIETITPSTTSLSIPFTVISGSLPTLPISGYNYWVINGGGSTVASGTTTTSPITVSGLTTGATYTINLNATNAYGTSGNTTVVTSTLSTITVSGGQLTTDYSGCTAYKFLNNGTILFTGESGITTINYVIVGGGGKGADGLTGTRGGGGGAGGAVMTGSFNITYNTTYTITVGAARQSSSAFSITASSGGDGNPPINLTTPGAIATNGTGYGSGGIGTRLNGGSAVGANGRLVTIGTSQSYFGGGGGGGTAANDTAQNTNGGLLGGGKGGIGTQNGTAGTANTGGGGGGGGMTASAYYLGGAGGSGIVIVWF
jgi:hypothetical protein